MAKCKLCKTNIPNGAEYCKDCKEIERAKANESYLDSLLNSVKNNSLATESIYKKKNSTVSDHIVSEINMNKETNPESKITNQNHNKSETKNNIINTDDLDMFTTVDISDIEDFEEFYNSDYIKDFNNNIEISNEELFGEDISDILSNETEALKKEDNDIKETEFEAVKQQLSKEPEFEAAKQQLSEEPEEQFASNEVEYPEDDYAVTNSPTLEDMADTEKIISDSSNQINSFGMDELEDEDNFDADINDLLNSLDIQNDTVKFEDQSEEPQSFMAANISANDNQKKEPILEEEEPDDDFLSLLQQISPDDPVDANAINDLLSGESAPPVKKANMPSDVGEVFSDALKAVSSLNDFDVDEESLLKQIPDKGSKKADEKKSKKNKKNKKNKKVSDAETKDLADGEKKLKKSLFKRLFGNVKDENAKEIKPDSKKYKSEAEVADKIPAKKAGKKDKKVKKTKKGASPEDIDETLDESKQGKNKKADKKEKKQDKTEKKKKTKEIIQVIDEIDEDEGKINRLGAAIVFVFFGLLVMLLLVGTKAVSYTLNIQNATSYFDKQKYNQAYNEVYGIEIKDEDIAIYDKIMTVMFVNKQLNSYNNYYAIKEYPQALDALLKGLKRYDKYIELATMLGIKTDLDYVRSQILAELNNVFNLSEKEAKAMIEYENMEEYSLEVYNVVLEKMNN